MRHLKKYKLKKYLHKDWKIPDSKVGKRGEIIQLWLDKHKGKYNKYIILDDDTDIEVVEYYESEELPEKVPLPLQANIWYKRYGHHSVAIIDYNKKTNALRVTNLKYLTSTIGWIFQEDLYPHLITNPDRSNPRWTFKHYKLKDKK